jgi:hypothetical protein
MQSLREKRAWIRARLDHVDALAQSLAGGTETDGPRRSWRAW